MVDTDDAIGCNSIILKCATTVPTTILSHRVLADPTMEGLTENDRENSNTTEADLNWLGNYLVANRTNQSPVCCV